MISASRNGPRARWCRCGNSVLATDGSSTCSPAPALYVRNRSQAGPSPRCDVRCDPQYPQNAPAGTSCSQIGQSVVGTPSGLLIAGGLDVEQIADEVVDVRRAETGDKVVSGGRGVDGVRTEAHVAKGGPRGARRDPVQHRVQRAEP